MNGKFQVTARSCRPCLIESTPQHRLLIDGLYLPKRETAPCSCGSYNSHRPSSWRTLTTIQRTKQHYSSVKNTRSGCLRFGHANFLQTEMRFSQAVLDQYTVCAKIYTAGGSAKSWLPVYDLVADRRSMRISRAHSNDVNSVCWADTASGNVLISGSDDGFVKVW